MLWKHMAHSDQILHGDQTRWNFLQGRLPLTQENPKLPTNTSLTRAVFEVANHLVDRVLLDLRAGLTKYVESIHGDDSS